MKTILIVDDSQFMRNVLKDLLMDSSAEIQLSDEIQIFEADGKVNAQKKLKEVNPDVILLDIVMQSSETEGLEFIEEIQDLFDTKKIIIISSIAQASVLDECNKLGIIRYLQKPFVQNQVIEAINKVL